MSEWTPEAEARRLCGRGHEHFECRCRFIAAGIRAGLERAAALCGERSDRALKASENTRTTGASWERLDGAAIEAEACEQAIKELLK